MRLRLQDIWHSIVLNDEDNGLSVSEEVFSSESSLSDDEVTSPELDKLYSTISCLTYALIKLKGRMKALQNELRTIREEIESSSICKYKEDCLIRVEELEKENLLWNYK